MLVVTLPRWMSTLIRLRSDARITKNCQHSTLIDAEMPRLPAKEVWVLQMQSLKKIKLVPMARSSSLRRTSIIRKYKNPNFTSDNLTCTIAPSLFEMGLPKLLKIDF